MTELTAAARAKIASRAQAAAHRKLREDNPEAYQEAYQAEKDKLTEAAEQG